MWLVFVNNFGGGFDLTLSRASIVGERRVDRWGGVGFGLSNLELGVKVDQVFNNPTQIINCSIKQLTVRAQTH